MRQNKIFLFLKQVPATIAMISLAGFCSIISHLAQISELNLNSPRFFSLFLSHFTHWDLNHFIWDGITFFILCWLYETAYFCPGPLKARRSLLLLLSCLSSALLISMGLILRAPGIDVYRGLSGLCVSIFVLLLIDVCRLARTTSDTLLLLGTFFGWTGLLLKTTYEVLCSQPIFVSATNYQVVPDAHMWGAIAALMIAAIARLDFNTLWKSVFPNVATLIPAMPRVILSRPHGSVAYAEAQKEQ